MSWSLSKERAIFFASDAKAVRRALLSGYRQGVIPMIVRGKCHKRDVLAYFNSRDEQEIVIDPRTVFSKHSVALSELEMMRFSSGENTVGTCVTVIGNV